MDATSAPPQVQGYIDERSTHHISGWLRNLADAGQRLAYEVVLPGPGGERILHTGIANEYSHVLVLVGVGDGTYAFQAVFAEPVTEAERDRIFVRPLGSAHRLELAPELKTAPPAGPFAYHLDAFWCDPSGMYFKGWIHGYGKQIETLEIQIGEDRAALEAFHDRPDVAPHYPGFAVPQACGFELYVPSVPGHPASFELTTPAGRFSVPIVLPRRELPPASPRNALHRQFVETVNREKLTLLELGARLVGPESKDKRQTFHGAGRYIGMDVHPGPMVDIVGDAHELSALTGAAALDAIYSVSVLEHLECPWIVAQEMNRALKTGGLVFHSTLHSWPLHEEPNDFWRFSDEALKVLFGPRFGFEVIGASMMNPVNIYPQFRYGHYLSLPSHQGFAEASILARKVAELPERSHPAGDAFGQRARQYPLREN
jgi:hypothetical protein